MMMTSPQFRFALRQAYQKVRGKLSQDFQNLASMQICNKIQKLNIYQQARQIALYHSTRGEINLSVLWKKAYEGNKISFFPALASDKTLRFFPATPKDLFVPNRYGILEPNPNKKNQQLADQLDIIFLPLVAFDRTGTRLGMGQGYYDRTLADSKPSYLIGVAYDFQCYPNLDPQLWDVPLDGVITPSRSYYFNEKLLQN